MFRIFHQKIGENCTFASNVTIGQRRKENECAIIGDNVYFGIRSKLVVYPDNVFVLWLSIGVRYYKIM
jgi:hypothetical protein